MTEARVHEAMTCPKCANAMRSYERNGIVVDQCTTCRGVFLDRGELERLVDAESAFVERARSGRDDYDDDDDDDDDRQSRRRRDDDDVSTRRRDDERRSSGRKRSSFLGNILEGFGGDS